MKLPLIILLFSSSIAFANHQPKVCDTSSQCQNLSAFFANGSTFGHVRNFFMTTINKDQLNDYWANATGGAIGYQSMRVKGFQLGVKGIFTFNTGSNDLTAIDPISNKNSKYEVELFDIHRPDEKYDLDRLEELYLNYKSNKHNITIGRQMINTPLANTRDGRMKPFVFSGLYGSSKWSKNVNINYGWISGVSPRSTTHFYSLEEAIQLESKTDSLHTEGLGILALTFNNKKVKVQVWDFYLDQINNTIWGQIDFKQKSTFYGLQYVYQESLQNQSEKAFHEPNQRTNIIALRAGKQIHSFTSSINFSRSMASGKLRFPRSLGREDLYTSMPLFWMEGKGDISVLTFKVKWDPKWKNGHFYSTAEIGQCMGLDNSSTIFNNYHEFDLRQYNLNLHYQFDKWLKGLELQLLYLYKENLDHSIPLDQLFNKGDFHQIHFISNINF